MSLGGDGQNTVAADHSGWRAVHVDEWLVVVDKASGLLSVPGIGPDKADCLASRVAAEHQGARIVHRLDRDTSGVIVLARDAKSHRSLSMAFEARLVEKSYVALVAGRPASDHGTIDAPMRKDLDHPPLQLIDPIHGRPSVTHWEVADWSQAHDASLLRLTPETGRSHQLRLHLQSVGHPILGDDLYAPAPRRDQARRLCLHAASLTFAHPFTGNRVTFVAPVPFSFASLSPWLQPPAANP